MSTFRRFSLLAIVAAVSLTPAQVRAVTLLELVQGQTITADDKLFNNWAVLQQDVNNGIINLNLITVTPIVDDPLNPGIKFTGTVDSLGTLFGHPGGAFARLRFSFQVQTTDGRPLIKDNSLLINDFLFDAGPNATIQITETLRDVTGAPIGDKSVIARNGDTPGTGNPAHFDVANFAPRSVVLVEKFIEVLGPGTNDGARLLMFEQRFSQIPEPNAAAIAAVLAVALGTTRYRERR